MPSQVPHIYIAFANDSRLSLKLSEEKRTIENYFLKMEAGGLLNLVLRDPVDLPTLGSDFATFAHRIEVIHFSGHGSAQNLYFELLGKSTQTAHALGLAAMMGKQRSLKLAFLNACATQEQAEAIQKAFAQQNPDAQLPAVIATKRPVNDEVACLFSQYFYFKLTSGGTVAEAFVHAKDMVQAHYGQKNGGYRDLYYEGQEADNHADFPWEILPGNRAEWRLPTEKAGEGLGEYHQYTCNRENQESAFSAAYSEGQEKLAQFFLLHGPEYQAHGSLPKRFRFEFMENKKVQVLRVPLMEATELNAYKSTVLFSLFKELDGERPRCSLSELTYERLCRSAAQQGFSEVMVSFTVESSTWKPFTPELMQWFSKDFCKGSAEYSPRILFFLAVVYAKEEKPQGFLKKLFAKDPNEELEKAVNALPFTRLEKLMPVKPSDIDKWMENQRISEYRTHHEQIRALYFQPKELYNMEEVELTLRKIIQDYNSKNPKIWDIIR